MADGADPSQETAQAGQHRHVPHRPPARAGRSPRPAGRERRRVLPAAGMGEPMAAPTTAGPGRAGTAPPWHRHRGGTGELGCAGSAGRAVQDGAVAGLVLLNPASTCKRGCPLASGAFGRCRPVPAREDFSPDRHQRMPILHWAFRPCQERAARSGVPSSRLRVQLARSASASRSVLTSYLHAAHPECSNLAYLASTRRKT